mgnify:CR=1 FL=1
MRKKNQRNILFTLLFSVLLVGVSSANNNPKFIESDPIQIPHQFSKLQDIEIMAFWTSMLAWGQRKTIINKATELVELMDGAPHDFMVNHEEKDRARFEHFKHRTFQPIDCLYFIEFFQLRVIFCLRRNIKFREWAYMHSY